LRANALTRALVTVVTLSASALAGLSFSAPASAEDLTVAYVTPAEMTPELAAAFLKLGPMRASLDPRSFIIATYALCGFANFSSIAIQIGGIGALAPSRKSDLARFGLRAVAAGSMANFMSACIAGMIL